MNGEDVQILVAARVRQAKQTLQDARILLESREGTPRSVINRAYYASFYAVLALLQTVGKAPRKHQGMLVLFDKEFVRAGHLPRSMSDTLHKLFQCRLEEDYRQLETQSSEDAVEVFALAEEFVDRVQQYLTEKNYLAGA